MAYEPAKFEVAMSNSLGRDAVFDQWPCWPRNFAQYPFHHVTYAVQFEVAMSICLGGDAFTRKYIILIFDLEVKVSQNFAQYPLHHVTYPPEQFEVATANS